MANSILYRQTQSNNLVRFLHGGCLCVCTSGSFKPMKADTCSRYFDEAKTVSKFAGHRSFSPRHRVSKPQESLNDFTSRLGTFAASLSSSTKKALPPSNQSMESADPKNSARSKRALLSRRPCARRTCWENPSDDGLWPSCVNISSRKRLLALLVWRRFGRFCESVKSGCDAQRRGRNATIRTFGLKKTDSQICKEYCGRWPDSCFRRVRAAGGSSSGRPVLVSQTSSPACDIHKTLRRATLAGVLRCSRQPALGIYPQPKTTPGNAVRLETSSQKVSSLAANTSDSGQLFAASQGRCEAVLSEEQCAFDLDADECIMAQSNRMSVYAGEGICFSQLRLRKPQTAESCFESLCMLQK